MERRGLAAGLLVVLAAVATVAIAVPPTVPGTVGTDTAPGDRVEVTGGELDVDPTALFQWTADELGEDVAETPSVQVTEVDESQFGTASGRRFLRLLVFEEPDQQLQGGLLAFVNSFSTDVTVNAARLPAVRNGTTGRTVEGLLVHEFTHVIQFQTPVFARNQPLGFPTSDRRHAWNAMAEGGAEFVADHYVEDDRVREIGAVWNDPTTPATYRLSMWDYYRGLGYARDRISDPADLWALYEDPPETTAAILRGETGGTPSTGSVDLRLEDVESSDDHLGAWFVEVALSRNLDPERARTVAEGWQWDQLVDLEPANATGAPRHVWVTEWRDADAADAFAAAMTDYLDDRWDRSGDVWTGVEDASFDVTRPGDRSVAVLVGPDAFLGSVDVVADGDAYAVVEDRTESTAPAVAPVADGAGAAAAGA